MIADLDDSARTPGEYDVVIVGSGPAGMTLACELADSGRRIAVLESGLARTTAHGDRLREVDSRGIHIKDYSRERVLGGASTTWAGLSSPLDEIDFAPRAFLQQSEWPVPRAELLDFYAQAAARYRFAELAAFEPGGFDRLRPKGDLSPRWEQLEEKVFLAAGEPQNFGKEWRSVFEREGVDLWLDATATELERDGAAGVASVKLRSRGGREVSVRGRVFVIATGGIENARLLLASELGNEHDQVGRYLMNHPKNYFGVVRFTTPVEHLPYYFGCLDRGFAGYAGLRLRTSEQVERELLNSYVRFEPLFPWTDSQGVESLVLLVKRSTTFFAFWKRRHADQVVELRDYSETGDDSDFQNARKSFFEWCALIPRIVFDLPRVSTYLFYRLTKARPKIRAARVRNFMEMEPRPENRVRLSSTEDPYGGRRADVEHSCSERDQRSMVAVHEALAAELARTGVGRLESPLGMQSPWPIDQDASHHMGTTRMGSDARTSVVDADLKVHSVENVYMAGSSVFPSSGCANPTFTIVALSIRLARHLENSVLGEGA